MKQANLPFGVLLLVTACSLDRAGVDVRDVRRQDDAAGSIDGGFASNDGSQSDNDGPGSDQDSDQDASGGMTGFVPSIMKVDYRVIAVGARVEVVGTHLDQVTGVVIGGQAQPFSVASATRLVVGPIADMSAGRAQLILHSNAGSAAPFAVDVIRLRINEIDNETNSGSDEHQFIEVATSLSDASLQGYFMVVFNGDEQDESFSIPLGHLHGEYFVVGHDQTSYPPPDVVFDEKENAIDVGEYETGAVAIYQKHTFGSDGAATRSPTLIDAVVFSFGASNESPVLLNLLDAGLGRKRVDESLYNNARLQSIQRCSPHLRDGSAFIVTGGPTPRAANDCH